MSIADKILRAKADYDAVYEAGYEKGKSEGGGGLTPSEGLYFEETYDLDGYVMYVNTYGWTGIGTCTDTEIVVPCANPANGRPVVSVGHIDEWYSNLGSPSLKNIIKVYLPDTITRIEDNALTGGESLKYIKFGKYLNYVGSFQWNYDMYDQSAPTDVVLDFSDFALSTPPTLSDISLLLGVSEIRVPSAMIDTFTFATNWASASDKIVGV